MRLPAVAIAAMFGCGAVLGQWPWMAQRISSQFYLAAGFAFAALLVVSGIFLAKKGRLFAAATISLVSWLVLGTVGVGIALQPRPADYVLYLIDSGRLDLKTPLRWHGRLRDEPARLPWGFGYEIELSEVEFRDELLRASGGLRLSFTQPPQPVAVPDVHAGDEVVVTAQAKRPQVYRDDGAFDRRAYLAQQGVDLIATLRAPELMERTATARTTASTLLAHIRDGLREKLDGLLANTPEVSGVLRAMLLGDRSFVDQAEAVEFQKTGVFHVLVVAGLHVGAIAVFLFWIGRKLKFAPFWTALTTLAFLISYVAVVEERPPVLRAALMTAIVVLGGLFFRRLDLSNSAGIAALLLLIAKPLAVHDSSFQLTFLAIGCIAGLAVPWLEKTVQPYVKAIRGWRDVTRDASHEPRAAQFRIDLRAMAGWASSRLPARMGNLTGELLARGIGFSLRIWQLVIISLALQIGMLPLMARDFHRVTLDAPIVNLAAVPLTGLIVPLGFLTLACGFVFPPMARFMAAALTWVTLLLQHIVHWFSHFQQWSYRIPGPPAWLMAIFFVSGALLALTARIPLSRNRWFQWSAIGVLGASALAIAMSPFAPKWCAGKLELTVLDVGQGDSLFVVSPNGKTMLIDGGGAFGGFPGREEHGGPDPGEEAVSAYLWSRGFQKLDIVALTHAHQDHIGGLTAVLENFRVGTLWIGREVESATLTNLENLARTKKIPIVHEIRGNEISWDGVRTQFLWPEILPEEVGPAPKNNDSLVLRLQYGEQRLLLPGDAEKQAESTILGENSEEALRADVLKVGHHGSKNSTTPRFLAAVHPTVAIISSGEDNSYGHPSLELLERLEAAGAKILRTDHDGAIHVLTDGKTMEINCFIPCSDKATGEASAKSQPPDEQKHRQQ